MTLLRFSASPVGAGLPMVEAKRRGEKITLTMKLRARTTVDDLEHMVRALIAREHRFTGSEVQAIEERLGKGWRQRL